MIIFFFSSSSTGVACISSFFWSVDCCTPSEGRHQLVTFLLYFPPALFFYSGCSLSSDAVCMCVCVASDAKKVEEKKERKIQGLQRRERASFSRGAMTEASPGQTTLPFPPPWVRAEGGGGGSFEQFFFFLLYRCRRGSPDFFFFRGKPITAQETARDNARPRRGLMHVPLCGGKTTPRWASWTPPGISEFLRFFLEQRSLRKKKKVTRLHTRQGNGRRVSAVLWTLTRAFFF